jgi:hypothetical protein
MDGASADSTLRSGVAARFWMTAAYRLGVLTDPVPSEGKASSPLSESVEVEPESEQEPSVSSVSEASRRLMADVRGGAQIDGRAVLERVPLLERERLVKYGAAESRRVE